MNILTTSTNGKEPRARTHKRRFKQTSCACRTCVSLLKVQNTTHARHAGRFASLPVFAMAGELTVLFADDQHALIYECYNVLSDGSCDKADTFVEIMTRHKRLYPEARQKIIDALSAACFTFDDLVLSAQDGT